jgi:hypothetical protein
MAVNSAAGWQARLAILRVGVPGLRGIRGLPGITGTEDSGCRLDFEGIVSENRFTRPYRSGLGEGQEPEGAGSEARGGGGLGALRDRPVRETE